MGLDIFFYATQENIAKDALEPAIYDKNAWNKAYEDGKVMRVGDSLRKNYPLHSYVCSSFVEDGGDSDLNCKPYPINHLIESILSLAKNREFDAFDMDDDEIEFGETYLSEIEEAFTELKKYAEDGYTIVYYAWY